MNRKIKFRAWDGKKIHLPEYSDRSDFHIEADGTIVETHEHGYERHELTSPRIRWKLMQFTGLTDKDGKEIYNGDIVKYPNSIMEIVDDRYGWAVKNKFTTIPLYNLVFGTIVEFEVIGNIYENPDLLK